MHKIVVGVDGSDASVGALRWAVKAAKAFGATVVALHAYPKPSMHPWPAMPRESYAEGKVAVTRMLEEKVEGLGDERRTIELRREVVEESATPALIAAAAEADLLVVGSRGRGGFRGLRLGSTSQQVAQWATCPVVVVPAASREQTIGTSG